MTKRVIFLLAMLGIMTGEMAAVDTLYVRQTDTIVIRETRYKKVPVTVEKEVEKVVEVPRTGGSNCEDKVFFVYFPLGRYSLDDAANKAIQEMAARLEDYPAIGLRLTGFCDYVGSEELNDKLSIARAKTVRNRLVELHGIAPERIIIEGKGKLANVKGEYSPNRRVEMRMIGANEWKADAKSTPKETATPATATTRTQTEPQTQEIKLLATETVGEYTTLARLARKYYNNTFCWVYIYAMNKSVIPNPNNLQVGQQLRIPDLGDVDKQITKQESEDYYKMLKR
jgi:outer membrane protein OmpA-like peptidoglycan-associated protein